MSQAAEPNTNFFLFCASAQIVCVARKNAAKNTKRESAVKTVQRNKAISKPPRYLCSKRPVSFEKLTSFHSRLNQNSKTRLFYPACSV
jgi:hypothetical protein